MLSPVRPRRHDLRTRPATGSLFPARRRMVPRWRICGCPYRIGRTAHHRLHRFKSNSSSATQPPRLSAEKFLPMRTRIAMGRRIDRSVPVEAVGPVKRGWFSGETHVHRRFSELPNAMLAEDLNVAFPVTFWTVRSDAAPGLEPSPLRRQGPSPFGPREDRGHAPIPIDPTHVILPRNTEYEIFSVGGRSHPLGAMFVLNHRSAFTNLAPPVAGIAAQAHAEGALLDLDKHSWPWSIMLVPVAKVDLFELRTTASGARASASTKGAGAIARLDERRDGRAEYVDRMGLAELRLRGHYALLNCGFRSPRPPARRPEFIPFRSATAGFTSIRAASSTSTPGSADCKPAGVLSRRGRCCS